MSARTTIRPMIESPNTDERADTMAARLRTLEGQALAREAELKAYQLQRAALLGALRRMTSSASWRTTRWLRALSRLLRPRRITFADAFSSSGMEHVSGTTFVAQDGNPQFLLPCVPVRGYVRVRARIGADADGGAHLYFDTGSLFNEGEQITLGNIKAGKPLEADVTVHLPGDVHCFRLDPVRFSAGAGARFTLEHFSITPLAGAVVDARSLAKRAREWRAGRPTGPSLRNGLKFLLRGDLSGFRTKLRAVLASTMADNGSDYQLWREARALDDAARQRWRDEAATLLAEGRAPKISVLVPTYNSPEKWLRAALDSVLAQTYPHWELCIVDDASPDPNVRKILAEYVARDPRIRVKHLDKNGNISAATNAALDLATGDFVALLDHDDALAEHALSSVAREIAAHPDVDMIYSDEDKITTAGKHLDPFFKPDWSPEYLLACMYTCHLGVYRASKLRDVGGFRSAFDSAQDYDLVLRLSRTTDKIRHVPDVLYHWRVIPNSTASGADAKPEAEGRARAALQAHLDAGPHSGKALPGPTEGYHRVRYNILGNPKVSIVIPTACGKLPNSDKYLVAECVRSIREKTTYQNLEIVVSDNDDMPPDLQAELARYDIVRAPFRKPFNLAVKLNDGAAASTGDHVLLLNDDIEVIAPDWIEELLSFSQLPNVGAVGAKLLFPDGLVQHAGVIITDGNPGHPYYRYPNTHAGYFYSVGAHRNFSAVTGACVMCPRDAYFKVGGFSPEFPLNYNDVDFCLKLRAAGYRIVYTPYAQLYHHESVSKTGTYNTELVRFKDAWLARFPRDPMFNPNLNPAYTDWRVLP